jgi:pantoate--beta-alanine ligase
MKTVTTIDAVRAWRRGVAGDVGFVPTMGSLHEGHLSLVRKAAAENEAVAASIFVNPAQFDDPEDLARYPRDPERDAALLAEAGCDLLFLPEPAELYPPGFETWVMPGPVAEPLEGASRAGHFVGVDTVVLKLLNIVQAQQAYFGQKDAQQVAVISAMARDLNVPTTIVPCPTVREADGLAMSSRNARLSPEERAAAPVLHRALQAARSALFEGERDAEALRALMRTVIEAEPLAKIDYVSVADLATLRELATIRLDEDGGVLLSMAVFVGPVRLIDNLPVRAAETTAPHHTRDTTPAERSGA